MLKRKGDADDGHRRAQTEHDVAHKGRKTTKDDPNDVHRQPQTPRRGAGRIFADVFAKRHQRKMREFEALQTKRNADDRQAKDQAPKGVLKSNESAATKDGPENVENESHDPSVVTNGAEENLPVTERMSLQIAAPTGYVPSTAP